MIHAWTLGNLPDERESDGVEHYQTAECPECGGQMRDGSQMCRKCTEKRRRVRWAEVNVPARQERHERFELALTAGWTVVELMEMKGKLPSRAEIIGRLIEKWWAQEPPA